MAEGPLSPTLERYGPIDPAHFLAVYLLHAKRTRSPVQLQGSLRKWAAPPLVERAITTAAERDHVVVQDDRVELTEAGRQAALEQLGEDAEEPRDRLLERRFPLCALGLSPDDAEVRRRIVGNQELTAAIVAVGFGLPPSAHLSRRHTLSELLWRTLRATMPELVGSGPFPVIDDPGVIGAAILNGLAGTSGASPGQVQKALAARALGIESTQMETIRQRLVQVALLHGVGSSPLFAAPLLDNGAFAHRVRETAAGLETPPFAGRVAIAQVYDAFGADCGTLEHFKERLVEAAKERLIDLSSLDMPEYMGAELRARSAVVWGEDRMHFVVSEWK